MRILEILTPASTSNLKKANKLNQMVIFQSNDINSRQCGL